MRSRVFLFVAILGLSCSPKAKEARHLAAANRYFEAGAYDQAEVEYLNALQTNAESLPALGRLGAVYYQQGRFGRAVPVLLESRQLDPQNLDVRLKLAAIYLGAGKHAEAREEARFVLAQRPLDAEAPIVLAETAGTPPEIDATRQELQKLTESAASHTAAGILNLRQGDLAGAETELKRALAIDPKFSAAYSALGFLYLTRNDLKQAEQAIQTAAEFAPARSNGKLQSIRFKLQTGDLAAARREVDAVIKSTPDYLPASLNLAEIAVREKKYDECAATIRKVLERDPGNYEAQFLSARLRLIKGEAGKAVTELVKLAEQYPESARLQHQLALAYLAGNETAKAVGSLNRALSLEPAFVEAGLLLGEMKIRTGDPSAAVVVLKQLIQKRPNIAQIYLQLALAYRAQGSLDEAVATYQKLMQLFPQDYRPHFLAGLVFLQQNQKPAARAAFDTALELAPDYLPALEQLVTVDLLDGQLAAALARLEKQVAKNPRQAGPHYLLAKIYLTQRTPEPAQVALLKALELQPDFPEAQILLARVYVSTKKHEPALVNLRQVVAKNPRDIGALMLIGLIESEQKNYPAAKDAYEKMLAVNPKSGPALNNLAYLYSEHLGDLEKAYQFATRAREALPLDPLTGDTLGWILYRKGQYPQALIVLKESTEKLAGEPEAQFHLGMAHYAMGEEEGARTALERALQLNKDFAGKELATQHLAVLAVDATPRASLQARVAAQPNDSIARLRLAALDERDGNWAAAVKAYQAVLEVNPKNVRALINLARLSDRELKDTPKAFELAKAAYKLAPGDDGVAFTLGRLACRVGDYRWAFSVLQEAARQRPGDPAVQFELARAAYAVGRVAEAQAAMQTVLKLDPAFSQAAEAQRFLDVQALTDNADGQIEMILKQEPNYVPALMVGAAISEQHQKIPDALATYEKVLSQYPDFTPAARRLVILSAGTTTELAKVAALAGKAREAFPNDGELKRATGILAYRRDDFATAVNLLQPVASERPADAGLFFYLGMAQYRLGQKVECKKSLESALNLKLAGESATEARRVLDQLQ
ncbi:MAG: tetratricopeptide repeat protein [Verrucomicrobiota bacterium]